MGWILEQKKPDLVHTTHRYTIYVWNKGYDVLRYKYCRSLERCYELLSEAKAKFPDAEKFTVETVTKTWWNVKETGGLQRQLETLARR